MTYDLTSLFNLIKQEYGIEIKPHQYQRVETFITSRGFSAKSLLEAFQRHDKNAITTIIEAISITESYFYRDASLFNLLSESLLQMLITNKKQAYDGTIRIWSAGCSRGEEIYSLIILLNELNLLNTMVKFEFVGTDINQSSLAIAEQGIYTKSSLRVLHDDLIKRYFTIEDGKYYLQKTIKSRVKFYQQNINAPFDFGEKFDIIFCRNVFIYFDNSAIEDALNKMYDQLNDNGYLILGPSDFVVYLKHKFKQSVYNGVHILTKTSKTIARKSEVKERASSYIEKLSQYSIRLAEIKRLLTKHQYEAVLKEVDQLINIGKNQALLFRYKAEALVGMNDLSTAEIFCDKSLLIEPEQYKALLLKAVILLERNPQKACLYFKKALQVNPNGVEPLFHLAEFAKNNNDRKKAVHLMKRCLNNCELNDDAYMLYGFNGVINKDLKLHLHSEVARLSGDNYG